MPEAICCSEPMEEISASDTKIQLLSVPVGKEIGGCIMHEHDLPFGKIRGGGPEALPFFLDLQQRIWF